METLNKANAAKADKHLDELIRYCNKFYTRRGLMNEMKKEGRISEVEEVPKYEYNRRKFNQMNYKEHQEYEKKLQEKKIQYRLTKDDRILVITKTEFDYFNTL